MAHSYKVVDESDAQGKLFQNLDSILEILRFMALESRYNNRKHAVIKSDDSVKNSDRYSLAMYYAHAVLKHFLRQGGDLNEVLKKSKISRKLLDSNATRIPLDQYCRLQANTAVMMGDEILGYTGSALPVGSWHVMCHAVISTETLGEALQLYCAFFNLINWGIRFEMWEEEDKVIFRPSSTTGASLDRYPLAVCMTNTFRFFSWLGEQFLPVAVIHFGCSRPEHYREYKGIFVATPVLFNQSDYRLLIMRDHLAKPLAQDIYSLRHFLRQPAYHMATLKYESALWSPKVRKILASDVRNMPSVEAMAKHLDMHQQTLRRRLADEGTSYREIRNNIRLDTALYFLGKRELSVQKVAERAGFSETSAFVRAFKHWTGVSPETYRRKEPKC